MYAGRPQPNLYPADVARSTYFDSPISGKERSRAGEAGPAMRENRQVFPHNFSVESAPGLATPRPLGGVQRGPGARGFVQTAEDQDFPTVECRSKAK